MSIPNGPSALAVKEAAWGLARYAAISQVTKPLKLLVMSWQLQLLVMYDLYLIRIFSNLNHYMNLFIF